MILTRIRKAARNQLIVAGLILAVTIGLIALSHRYWYNFIFGPFAFDEAIGGSIADPETFPRNWVALAQYATEDLGLDQSNSERITARYVSILVGNRYLLAEVAPDFPGGAIATAEIVLIPYPVRDYIGSTLFKANPLLASRYFSFMVRVENFRQNGYIVILVSVPVLFVGLRKLRNGVRWLSSPETHPISRTLAVYGNPLDVRGEIESELAGGPSVRIQSVVITKRWLLQERASGLDVARVADVVWVYQKEPSHSLILRDREGQSLLLFGQTRDKSDRLLAEIHERAPWAFVGYDGELDRQWFRDRGAVIQAAMERAQRTA